MKPNVQIGRSADNLTQVVAPLPADHLEAELIKFIVKHRILTTCIDEAYRAWSKEPVSSVRKNKMEQDYKSALLTNRLQVLAVDDLILQLGYIPKIS